MIPGKKDESMREAGGEDRTPLVSVILPVHNGAAVVRQAMDSVFLQDVPLELVAVDDCSEDGTWEILEEYGDRENFRRLKNEKNEGVAASRNRGVREARGTYVAFLDADDWWERGKLKAQLRLLEESGSVLCSTGRTLCRYDGTSTGKYIPVKREITYRELLKHNCISCSSVLMKRDVALEFPMEHDEIHEDYLTWLRILRKYDLAVGLDRPCLNYRLSQESKSGNKLRSAVNTYRVYRCMGYGAVKSCMFFLSYAVHGVRKYWV